MGGEIQTYVEAKNYWFLSNKQFYTDNYGFNNNYKWPIDENNMSNVSHVLDALLDEDTRALVDAGYLANDLSLTNEGKYRLTIIAFDQNRAALVAAAKEQLAKAKK